MMCDSFQRHHRANQTHVYIGVVVLMACLFAACTPEPVRRSAVDSSSGCSNDAENHVWNGSCLRTSQTSQKNDEAAQSNKVSNTGGGGPTDGGGGGSGGPTDGGGGGSGSPATAPRDPAAGTASVSPATPPRDPAADTASGIKVITDAINKHGDAAVAGINKKINGGDTNSGNTSNTAAKIYVVTFSKDSFIGIADSAVVKNCFVGSGSVITVKGEPKKVAEFSSIGVNQYVTDEVTEVNLTGGSSESCALKGKDFVYLGAHASAAEKP